MKTLFKLVPFLLLSLNAQAGGWVSSGGEIYQDETNPWFLSNVSDVKFCVVTGASFSASRDEAVATVKKTFDYWKSEFARVLKQSITQGEFAVATQTFTEVDCGSANVDIRFQFGFETLTPEQKTFLVDPLKYIGVAVRTEYDTVQMRGKGFVFVASDSGPNAYHNSGSLITNAWQKPHLLQYVLLHEVGHVFGLPHAGGGVMSQTFLEQVLNTKLYETFGKVDFESYLSPSTQTMMCQSIDAGTRQWFGLDPQSQCIVLIQNATNGYDVYSQPLANSPASAQVKLGTLKSMQLNVYDIRSKPAMVLNLTSDQKLFTETQTGFREFINGPTLIDQGGATTFIPANGTAPKPGYLRVSPTSLAVFGASGPTVKPVYLYNSILATLLMALTPGGTKK